MAKKKTRKSHCTIEGEGKWTIKVQGSSMKFQFQGYNFFAEISIDEFRESVDYVRGVADRDKPSPLYDHFADVMMRRGLDIKGD